MSRDRGQSGRLVLADERGVHRDASRPHLVLRRECERPARVDREHDVRLESPGRSTAYSTPKSLKVDPGVYSVTAASPLQSNWRRDRRLGPRLGRRRRQDDREVRERLPRCRRGAGNGLLGEQERRSPVRVGRPRGMVGLNLRNADGSHFVPGSYSVFKGWIGKTSARTWPTTSRATSRP